MTFFAKEGFAKWGYVHAGDFACLGNSGCIGPKADGMNHVFANSKLDHGVVIIGEKNWVSLQVRHSLGQPSITAGKSFVTRETKADNRCSCFRLWHGQAGCWDFARLLRRPLMGFDLSWALPFFWIIFPFGSIGERENSEG